MTGRDLTAAWLWMHEYIFQWKRWSTVCILMMIVAYDTHTLTVTHTHAMRTHFQLHRYKYTRWLMFQSSPLHSGAPASCVRVEPPYLGEGD